MPRGTSDSLWAWSVFFQECSFSHLLSLILLFAVSAFFSILVLVHLVSSFLFSLSLFLFFFILLRSSTSHCVVFFLLRLLFILFLLVLHLCWCLLSCSSCCFVFCVGFFLCFFYILNFQGSTFISSNFLFANIAKIFLYFNHSGKRVSAFCLIFSSCWDFLAF